MESAEYKKQYDEYLARAEKALSQACERYLPEGSDVCRAARYSLLGGGKRIRAVLVLAVCDMLHGNAEAAEQFAAAVEMLHCYSLIHDDLPCMDNDDMRRGKPSCHKAFGESTAMLAGDVLLTESFEAVAGAPAPASVCVHAAQALGAGAGSRGMVYGQELDLKYEALAASEEQLRLIHRHKTGALINAAIQMGGAAAQADEVQRKALEAYAYGIGLVFQVVDDVLDVTGTAEQLGKPIGSDSENGKTTFATLFGVDGAMQLAEKLNDETCTALRDAFGEKSAFLEQLARTLLNRRSSAAFCAEIVSEITQDYLPQMRCFLRRWLRDCDKIQEGEHTMQFIKELFSVNEILTVSIVGWFVAQVLKTIINFILLGKLQLERMWGDGGMPSAHSATVCAMVIAAARSEGVSSAIFAVASVVAIITMHDAMGVRHETGEQAKVLNQMIEEWIDISEKNSPFLQNMHLKEMVGHTPLQVMAGMVVGIVVGCLYPMHLV